MSALAARALLFIALGVSWPSTAEGRILSAIAKAAKAAGAASKAGKGAGAAGKTAGAASQAGKASLLAGGTALAAERAATLFKAIPDEAGTLGLYLAREPNGMFRTVTRTGEHTLHAPDEVGVALAGLARSDTRVNVYVDASAALEPSALPRLGRDQRLFVLDAQANPHPVRIERTSDGKLDYLVDAGETAMDLADFAADVVAEEDDDTWFWVVGGLASVSLALVAVFWLRKRRRASSTARTSPP